MRNILLLFIFAAIACGAVSCSQEKFFVFDDVICVERFPVECSVINPEILEIDAFGIQGIEIFDDFILVSSYDSCGCLSAFGKDGMMISSPFLKTGRGPGEILYRPFISWLDFKRNSYGNIVAGMFDFKGQYIEYDVTGTLDADMPVWKCVADSLPLSSGARYFRIDDNNFLCRRRKSNDDGYDRFIESLHGGHYCNSAMEYLNSITSSEINLLSTYFLVNPEKTMVAELGSRLNVINLYSIASDFKATIILGKEPENILDMEMKSEDEMSKNYYDAKAYEDFFVGLYLGTTLGELDEGNFSEPKLHFFSWDGEPLADISLPVRTLFFDIDLTENKLYVVEYETEKILRYDISELLNSKIFKNIGKVAM